MPHTSQRTPAGTRVKSYWETLSDLLRACCSCCIGARPKTEYERLLEEEEEQLEDEVAQSPFLLRWIALLLSGYYLPDNYQLYALLFRCAGWIEGLQLAKQGEGSEVPLVGESMHKVLEESQLLCKGVAKWLTSSDADLGDGRRVPNGNSRSQLQRLVFHLMRCFQQQQGPVSVDKDQALQSLPAVSTLQAAAQESAEDVRLAASSLLHIFVTFLTSRQLTDLVRDGLNFLRDQAADAAQAVAQEASAVENTVRPDSDEREGTLGQQVQGAKSATQEAVSVLADVNPIAAATSAAELPHIALDSVLKQTPTRNEVAQGIGRTIGQLMDSDASFRGAVRALARLGEKYRQAGRALAQGDPSGLPGASHTTESPDQPVEVNQNLVEAGKALEELLEGIAGGKSVEPVKREVYLLWADVREDVLKAFDEWMQEAHEAIFSDHAGGDGSQSLRQSLEKLAAAIESIITNRPDLKKRIDHILDLSGRFLAEMRREPRLLAMSRHVQSIAAELTEAVVTSTASLSRQYALLFQDFTSYILPAVLKLVGAVPLPRLEYHSPQVDVALDDVSVAAVNLLPAKIRLQMTETLEWDRTEASTPGARISQFRFEASGIRLALKNVSFFVREKATQISTPWLNQICCAMPNRRQAGTLAGETEGGHLAAYREQALLDVGLFGQAGSLDGGSISLDLSQRKVDEAETDDLAAHRFLTVNDSALRLGDSFNIRLKQSHHPAINTLIVEGLGRPLARTVLEHLGSGFIQHAIESLDGKAADFYRRAKRVAYESRKSDSCIPQDFIRVALDASAGKSPERLAKEQREKEEEEKARRQESEDGQGGVSATVKPMAVIVQLSPDTSMSIGAYPTLLPSYAQGPVTDRMQVRNAVAEDNWRDLAAQRAYRTVAEVAEGVRDVSLAAQDVKETVAEGTREVQEGRKLAEQLHHVATEREEIDEAREQELRDEGEEVGQGKTERWYHAGFDLS
ncbi:unnamed protein product [Parajaminaea phylloscopi]